ncbi:MAG: Gfo/Idh/MocA family protein [Anaerolineae bacterium]
MASIGTAIIGCGKVGHTHAQALRDLDESRLVAICDSDGDRVRAFADLYKAKPYTDLAEMLRNPEIQMVSVCVPQHLHVPLGVRCLEAGKNVLMEKPMAVDLKGCDALIAAAKSSGAKLGMVSQRRFYEPVQRVHQAIEAGKIGRPILGTVSVMGWRDEPYYKMDPWRGKWASEGGGVMLTQASHQLDLFQWLMGPIDELFGYWGNLNHPYIEVEDTAVAVMRFKSGALGNLLVSNSQKPGLWGKIHVHGENGASVGVQTDGSSPFVSGVTAAVEPPINDIWTVPGEEHLLEQFKAEDTAHCATIDVMAYYHKLQIRDFLQAVRDDREPAVTGYDGRRQVELFTAIYRSQRDGRPIKFPLDAEEGSELFDGRLAGRAER